MGDSTRINTGFLLVINNDDQFDIIYDPKYMLSRDGDAPIFSAAPNLRGLA